MAYPVGQTIPVTVTWRNADGDIADPDTIELKVEEPDGTENTYTYALGTVTKDDTGVYSKQVTLSAQGYWVFRWRAAGNGVDAIAPEIIEALPSELVDDAGLEPWALVTMQEARAYLRARDTSDDGQIARLINDASTAFLNAAEFREFKKTTSETREFDVDRLVYATGELRIGDAATVTTVEFKDRYGNTIVTVDADDRRSLPENRRPWEPIRRIFFLENTTAIPRGTGYRCAVTGEFGFPSVPGDVRQAVLEEVESRHGRDLERLSEIEQDAAGGNIWATAAAAEGVRSLTRQAFDVASRYADIPIA